MLSLSVFDKITVRALSSSPRLPLCHISFLLRPPLLS